MDIKRKVKEKRIIIVGVLLGICVTAVSLFCFFYIEKADAEKRMVEIVNYVKVQCSTYTHFNESSESKSLLRAVESARQMSTNIEMKTENGGQLSRDFLKENLQTLWVNGILVRFFRNYPLLLLYPMYLNFASSNCLPHLPYIVRFIIFNLLLVPSTNPLL